MTLGGKPDKRRTVFEYYARLIDAGTLLPGDRLPIYSEIERQHGISHVTAVSVIRGLKENLYVRTSTAGIVVHMRGPSRLYQLLCNALNALEDAGEQLQVEESAGMACIAGKSGGAHWNPETKRWEAPAS